MVSNVYQRYGEMVTNQPTTHFDRTSNYHTNYYFYYFCAHQSWVENPIESLSTEEDGHN